MKKKLKIKFWRAEKALAMQILEQEGLPERKGRGFVTIVSLPFLAINTISLRGNSTTEDFNINSQIFSCNEERDAYLNKITQAITDELFTSKGELKVGEYCEVRNYKDYGWERLKLLSILPDPQTYKYICEASDDDTFFYSYVEARPIKYIEPKVEECGEIITYTWAEE
jgi:hypothetical protein